jgi:hypothetical protein
MQQCAPTHTHNIQPLQGAVLEQRFCNRNKAIGANAIVPLTKNKIMIENKTFMQHRKKSATHKPQPLHSAVGSHGVCDATSAVGAEVVVALQKNCGSVEFRK